MTPEELEKRIAEIPDASPPREWRAAILQTALTPAEPEKVAAPPWRWSDWLWPCPQAWIGLAACWLILGPLHLVTGVPVGRTPSYVTTAEQETSITVITVASAPARLLELFEFVVPET